MIDINSDEMKQLLDYARLKKSNQAPMIEKVVDLGPLYCKICGNEFLYKSNVSSHMKKNIKCNIIRLEKDLKEVLKK
jgi:hypothetical protein